MKKNINDKEKDITKKSIVQNTVKVLSFIGLLCLCGWFYDNGHYFWWFLDWCVLIIMLIVQFISFQISRSIVKPEHLADEILRDMQIIKPEELIALIKKQGNKVYYRQNNIYEYINIPIILRGKKDYKFDIIYYFLTNGSDNIKERISRMIGRSLGNTLLI